MKIGICDDNAVITEALARLVRQCFDKLKIEAEISTFFSGNELLEKIEDFSIVFLDIAMPEKDGIEVGQIIGTRNKECKIIMATSKAERFKEAFQINAFRFVTKPFDIEEIEEALKAFLETKIGEEEISLFFDRQEYLFPQKDVKYFRAYDGYVEARVGDRSFRKDISLNQLEEILEKRLFVRVHKQYIVNLRFVEMCKMKIKIDDVEIPVARRRQKAFEKASVYYDINIGG